MQEERREGGIITGLQAQVRRPERVSIFIDGEFALGVHVDVVVSEGLRVGLRVDVAALEKLARSEEFRRAKESALHQLGYRARSHNEIHRHLERKGYEPELITEVLESLASGGYLDDREFSQAWVANRTAGKAMGPARLAAELRQKGVDKETIREALTPIDEETQLQMAVAVAQQRADRMSGEDPREARKKLSAMLMRRGFSWPIASKAVSTVLSTEEDEDIPLDD